MKTKQIFSDFNTVSAKQWKQKIQMDLKGADFNETLLTNTLEGITIQPFYHKETYKSLDIPKLENQTNICQTIFINDEKIVNNIAKEALQKGADAIRFIADKPFIIKQVFDKLPNDNEYVIICNFYEDKFLQKLLSVSKEKNIKIVIDIINNFAKTGNWLETKKTDFENFVNLTNNNYINIGINSSLYQNSGANIIQQIAYSLSHVNEYLNLLENNKQQTHNYIFTFAIGGNYFFEISKIRAFRYLIKKLLSEYNSKSTIQIILEPTNRNKTLYDYNVNLLRTSTESMSAILSGADFVCNTPYDAIYHRSNEFGNRIARNQLLVLIEESYFNKESDIAKGSYYIEQITYEIASKSLTLFKDIEKNGGFLDQLIKGTIQRKIEEASNKEQFKFDNGELILLGTNKYPNLNDKMKDDLELYPFVKIKPRKTIIKPIIPRRLAEKIEQERLSNE